MGEERRLLLACSSPSNEREEKGVKDQERRERSIITSSRGNSSECSTFPTCHLRNVSEQICEKTTSSNDNNQIQQETRVKRNKCILGDLNPILSQLIIVSRILIVEDLLANLASTSPCDCVLKRRIGSSKIRLEISKG